MGADLKLVRVVVEVRRRVQSHHHVRLVVELSPQAAKDDDDQAVAFEEPSSRGRSRKSRGEVAEDVGLFEEGPNALSFVVVFGQDDSKAEPKGMFLKKAKDGEHFVEDVGLAVFRESDRCVGELLHPPGVARQRLVMAVPGVEDGVVELLEVGSGEEVLDRRRGDGQKQDFVRLLRINEAPKDVVAVFGRHRRGHLDDES